MASRLFVSAILCCCIVPQCWSFSCTNEGDVITCSSRGGAVRLRNTSFGLPLEVVQAARRLHLEHAHIGDLEAATFADFKSVTEIRLRHNNLRHLRELHFYGLNELRRLDLARNNLVYVRPNAFAANESVDCVLAMIDRMGMSKEPDDDDDKSFGSVALQILARTLAGAQLLGIVTESRDFCTAGHVRDIDLSHNSLDSLPDELFANLSAIARLDLRHNRLSALPATLFGRNNTLDYLFLSDNRIRTFSVERLTMLKHLDVSHNALTAIGRSTFAGNPLLVDLNLGANAIEHIAVGAFTANVQLKTLDLGRNRLAQLSSIAFANNRQLVVLNLGHNHLSTVVDNAFFYNVHLKKLGLNDNHLTNIDVDAFSTNHLIEELSLANNKLERFEAVHVRKMANLQHLNLHNNLLKTLGVEMLAKETLYELYLSCNRLSQFEGGTAIDRDVYGIRLNLHLSINPWKCGCLRRILANERNLTIYVERKYFLDGRFASCIADDASCDANTEPNYANYMEWASALQMHPEICIDYELAKLRTIKYDYFAVETDDDSS